MTRPMHPTVDRFDPLEYGGGDSRLVLKQSQPLGNERFYAKIEQVTGMRREARPRGRPRMDAAQNALS